MQLFHHRGVALRAVLLDNEPWFVAADACRMLSLRDTTSAMKMVDADDKQGLRRSDTPQLFKGMAPQVQMMTVVNESGLYSLIFQSTKDEAKDFRRWVTKDVLPAIRKSGTYSRYPAAPQQLPSKRELAQWVVEAEDRAASAEARAAELEPSAVAWDRLHELGADYEVADAAKILSRDPNIEIGRNRLFEFMHDQDWIFRGRHNCWKAYQDQVDLGRLKHRPGGEYFHKPSGEYRTGDPTILITAKGLAELRKLLGGTPGQLSLVSAS
ncbi:hypothetical protein AWB94_29010 [Mycolicibacterium canariasense]|nr:hypothetical protein AWB94_29010 [Mycolicibacterium canariasense]